MLRFLLSLLLLSGTAVLRAQSDPSPGLRRTSDVIYTKHDGVALTMDVLQPAKPNGAGIIRVVSGGWRSSHRSLAGGPWSQAGYTTFVVVHGTQPRFNLGIDPGERFDVAAQHPDVVAELKAAAETHRTAMVIAPTQLR